MVQADAVADRINARFACSWDSDASLVEFIFKIRPLRVKGMERRRGIGDETEVEEGGRRSREPQGRTCVWSKLRGRP